MGKGSPSVGFLAWRSREPHPPAPDLKDKQSAVDKKTDPGKGGNGRRRRSSAGLPAIATPSRKSIFSSSVDSGSSGCTLSVTETPTLLPPPFSLSNSPPLRRAPVLSFFPLPRRPQARPCFSFSPVKVMNHTCAEVRHPSPQFSGVSPHPPPVNSSQSQAPFPCSLFPFSVLTLSRPAAAEVKKPSDPSSSSLKGAGPESGFLFPLVRNSNTLHHRARYSMLCGRAFQHN